MIMELPVSTVKPGGGKRVFHCIHYKGDAFHLVFKTVRQFTTHYDCRRFIRFSVILVQESGDWSVFPQRAVMNINTFSPYNFEVCTPHINPYHILETFPLVSKRTLPSR